MLASAIERTAAVSRVGWRHHYPRMLYKGQQSKTPRSNEHATFSISWFNPLSWVREGFRARRFERVCFAWVSPFDAIPYWIIAAVAQKPTSAQIHNISQHEHFPFEGPLTRLFLRRMDTIVAHSSIVEQEILALVPTAQTTVVPLPSLVDIPEHRKPPSRAPLRLLQPGYVRSYKGADLAIGAVKVAIDAGVNVELRIVGRFWDVEPAELLARAQRLGVEDSVTIDDRYLSDDELIEALHAANAVILPYRSASQSGIIPICLQAGRPVVATNVGGLTEQLHDGVDSVVAQQPTSEALGEAVVSLNERYDVLVAGASRPQPTWDDVANALVPADI